MNPAAIDAAAPDAVAAVVEMLRAASPATRQQVHRLLGTELETPPTARELRLAELGFLNSLLPAAPELGCEFTLCERVDYDETRPSEAPSSRYLVERYGSWPRACRAAFSLDVEAKRFGPGKPWATTNRGKPHVVFTQDDLLDAVRRCANELCVAGLIGRPTSWQYDEWVRRRKGEAKKRGEDLRLPYAKAVYDGFPEALRGSSRWQWILDLAGVE